MGETGRAEDQSHPEGELIPGILEEKTGRQEVPDNAFPIGCSGGDRGQRAKELSEIKVVLFEHQYTQEDAAAHEQYGLHDLHPCGGEHAAENHVNDHEDANPDHRGLVGHSGEQLTHKRAGTHHLRDHVEERDGQRAQRCSGPDGTRLETIGKQVSHRVLSGVAERFGDHEKHGQIGDQEAHRIHESVVPVEGDHSGDAKEAGSAHVITGDGESVLPTGDAAACGEIGAGARGTACAEVGDDEGREDEPKEHPESDVAHGTGGGGGEDHIEITWNGISRSPQRPCGPILRQRRHRGMPGSKP